MYITSSWQKLWVAVADNPFIPKGDDNTVKHPKNWTHDETKNASYDLKVRNILISDLSVKVFYSISHHTSAKATWDAIQTLYEKIDGVNDSKINMLAGEFKLFRIEPRESVESMQTRFLHLINKLHNLGKFVSKKYVLTKY